MLRVDMLGPGVVTVKATPLLATPPTVTTTYPGVAPAGTTTPMLVGPQLLAGAASVPLNVTVLVVPCDAPKFVPVIVTDIPTGPDVGFTFVMLGAGGGAPPAALNAANPAPQLSDAASDTLADAVPAGSCI